MHAHKTFDKHAQKTKEMEWTRSITIEVPNDQKMSFDHIHGIAK